MKPKLLSPVIVLFIATIGVVFSCSKQNDSTEETAVTIKFKSNEWPTFVISKEHLAGYFAGDNLNKLLKIILRSDVSNLKNSMELVAFGIGEPQTITQDANIKTELKGKLAFGNNVISVFQIAAICRINGDWINNFEFLRFTPIESTHYSGHLAFTLSACDKDGKILQSTNLSGRSLSGGESNPSPPADVEPCPAGQHYVTDTFFPFMMHCVPN